jgi:hypothetical protein
VDSRVSLDYMEKCKFLPTPGLELRRPISRPARSQSLYCLRYLSSQIGSLGRVVAQAVSRWIPTAAARVRVRAACWVCVGQSGTGSDFLRVLRFPLPIIPPISPSS